MTEPKRIQFGQHVLEVKEPVALQPVAADIITEVRLVNGMLAVSFASLVFDGGSPPEARICARLRVSLETVADLQRNITRLLENAAKAKESAN